MLPTAVIMRLVPLLTSMDKTDQSNQEDSMMVVCGTSLHCGRYYAKVVCRSRVDEGVGDQEVPQRKPDPVHKNAFGDPNNDLMCLDAVGVAPLF